MKLYLLIYVYIVLLGSAHIVVLIHIEVRVTRFCLIHIDFKDFINRNTGTNLMLGI